MKLILKDRMSKTGVCVFVDQAERPQRETIEICVVGPVHSQGGIARSVMYTSLVYRMLGFKVRVVPFPKRMSVRNCRVIHTHGPLFLDFIKMIFENSKAIRIITFHGWVLDEAISFLRYHKDKNVLRRIGGFFLITIIWLLNKYLFLRLYHCVTAVSSITARKNGVKALVIPNPFIGSYVDKASAQCIENPYREKDAIKLVTYVSIGGGKFLSIPRLIGIVKVVNKLLEPIGKKAILYVFGKDIPQQFIDIIKEHQDYVKYMGYRPDYPCYLKFADLFVAGYTMPELGHAVIEAISLGIPIAKYMENVSEEEIRDGMNGILAYNDAEMVLKLYNYVTNIDLYKAKLSRHAQESILLDRSLKRIALIWNAVIKILS